MDMQYRLTERGKEALARGDYLMCVAHEAGKDGVVTSEEIAKKTEMTRTEADYMLSVLSRLNLITPAPIQGVRYSGSDARKN